MIEKFPDKEWTKPGKLVNNGPFKLLEWKLNNYIKLVPNEHYWNKEKIKVTSQQKSAQVSDRLSNLFHIIWLENSFAATPG